MTSSDKVYFPGLNSLRFIAAYAVVITHIELLKATFGFNHSWQHPIIQNLGGLGVYFFFVLSGFLITYLLLVEKSVTGRVHIKDFYFRRIFRIWPLYYFIFILGFFILPHLNVIDINYLKQSFEENYWSQLFLYLFMLPNLSYAIYGPTPHIGQSWSIGVEEQFYLFWPLLVRYAKKPLKILTIIIIIFIGIKTIILLLSSYYSNNEYFLALKKFAAMSKFECMAIGSIAAYTLYRKIQFILNIVYHKYIQILSVMIIPILIFLTPDSIQDGIHILYSISFAIIITNISSNKDSIIKLNNKKIDYLGRVSYGIYMYHMMIIPIVLYFLNKLLFLRNHSILLNTMIYVLVTLVTIFISILSYEYFEKPFIKLKNKYAHIQSDKN